MSNGGAGRRATPQKDAPVTDAASQPDTQPAADTPASSTPATPAAATPAARKGHSLTLLALLLGAGGLLLGGWNLSLLQGGADGERQQQAQLQAVQGQTESLQGSLARLDARLARLPAPEALAERERLLAELQASQQQLAQRVDRVLGASRQEWRLAEAEHLLRLASLRLIALQDVNSARFLVDAADQILRDQDDPSAFAAREQLARSLEALRRLPAADRTGLFLQLAALGEQTGVLNTRRPEFRAAAGSLPEAAQVAEGDGASRWAQWWQRLSGFVRLEFSAEDEVRPLLAGETLAQLRLALRLALEQAQWAALNAEPQVYRTALEQGRSLLERYFGLDEAQNLAFYERLGELAQQPVAQELPDLNPALNALQAYLDLRARAELEAAAQAAAAVEAGAAGATESAAPAAPPAAPVQAPAEAAQPATEMPQ